MGFTLGPLKLYPYGAIIALGVLAGFLVAERQAKVFKISLKEVENVYLLLIPSCVLGARLYHVFHQWGYYSQLPKEILAIWQGGLGVFGALVAGLFALGLWAKIKRLSFLTLTDLLSPSVALTQAIGRLANFFNQEVFGPPTRLPWGVYIPLEKRPIFWQKYSSFHPLFLYESLFLFLSFFLLLFLASKFPQKKGLTTGAYFVLYGVIRFLTEFGRFDTWEISGFKVAQILSLLSVFAGIFLVVKTKQGLWCRRF